MTYAAKKRSKSIRRLQDEPVIVYHGIKIAPIMGKRSATAKAIREALQKSVETSGAETKFG